VVHPPTADRATRGGDLVIGLTTGTMHHLLPHATDPMQRALWMSELVYGTLAVLIAIAGVEVAGGGVGPTGAGAIILVGAAATWFAHAYATVLGHRVAVGGPATVGQIGHALAHAWPIALAAVPSVVAFGGASLGWWSPGAARGFSNGAGIAVLAGAGWIAGRAAGASLAGQLASTALTASIGVGIVAMELLLHR
jgi:hypothetical protein